MTPKRTWNIENYPTYDHKNLSSMLYSLKSIKYMFTSINHQANDLPETEMS